MALTESSERGDEKYLLLISVLEFRRIYPPFLCSRIAVMRVSQVSWGKGHWAKKLGVVQLCFTFCPGSFLSRENAAPWPTLISNTFMKELCLFQTGGNAWKRNRSWCFIFSLKKWKAVCFGGWGLNGKGTAQGRLSETSCNARPGERLFFKLKGLGWKVAQKK